MDRPVAQVDCSVAQKIEGDEGDGGRGTGYGTGDACRYGNPSPFHVGEVNSTLQLLESGRLAFVIERDNLAV